LNNLNRQTLIFLFCLFVLGPAQSLFASSEWYQDSVYYYVDEQNTSSLESIKNASFIPVNDKELNFADLNKNIWIKIYLDPSEQEQRFLLIDYPLIDSLSFWSFTLDSLNTHFLTGSHLPFASRPIKDNLFRFPIPPNTNLIILKARSRLNLQLPLRIIDQEYTETVLAKRDFLQATYLGLMILAILGAFIIGLISRGSRVFFAYIGHLIGTSFIVLHLSGYAFQYLWPAYPSFNVYEPWIFGLGIFSTLFSMEFLQTRVQAPRLNRLLWVSLIFNFSVFPLLLFGEISLANQIVQIVGLLGCLLMLVAGIIMYLRGYKPARFFILAWSVFLVGVIITILQRLSIIPLSEFSLHASQIGSAIDVILLFAALADRINTLQLERDAARKEAFAALEKNKISIEAQNQLLESKIAEKTEQLEIKNQALEKLNNQQGKILNIIGHDLKGPIASLGQALNLMRNDKNLITTEFLDMLQTSTISSFSLLENLLSWSYASESNLLVKQQKIDIKALCQNIIALNQPTLHQKGIGLDFQSEDNCFALSDERMLMTVIRNLISNAIKFSPKGKTITIKILRRKNLIEIEICDQGSGIESKVIEKILNGDSLTSTNGTSGETGTGFGLKISLDFLKKMSGNMEISSTISLGSCFKVLLPAVP
jgi:signal transduction histidine kinase